MITFNKYDLSPIDLTRMAKTGMRSGFMLPETAKAVQEHDDQNRARLCSPPDGRYTLEYSRIEFPEPNSQLGLDVRGPKDDGCLMHLNIQNVETSKFYTIIAPVDHYMYDVLRHLGSPANVELRLESGHIVYSAGHGRNREWDDMNDLSPFHSEYAKNRVNMLEALGAHHLIELSPEKKYFVAEVEALTDENHTTGTTRGFVFVSLLSKNDKAGEDNGQNTGLLIYFPVGGGIDPVMRRVYRFFLEREGTFIKPKTEIPTVLKARHFDALLNLVTSDEPKLKQGEVYVLDSVSKQEGGKVILRAHHIKDHSNFDLRYVYPNAPVERRGPLSRIAKLVRTGKEDAQDPALERENELILAERESTITVKLQGYEDNVETRRNPWTQFRMQEDLYNYFKSFEESYAEKGRVKVFSVTVDMQDGTLSYMEAPQTTQSSPFVFEDVAITDEARIEIVSRRALSYRDGPAGRIN